jgi:hypothetical protein
MAFGARTLRIVLAALALTPGACMHAQSSSQWISLFDGKNTGAWRGYLKSDLPASWQVVDGALTATGDHGEDIITRDQFDNFELELEWKLQKGGNSGIFFHVQEDPKLVHVWESAPEFQVLDNQAHADAKDARTSAASNYALDPPARDVTKPIGEWNRVRIIVNGAHVEHWMNGEKLVDYDMWTDAWKQRVAASKFKSMPAYGLAKTGHIALQGDHGWVAYRNIRIRRL